MSIPKAAAFLRASLPVGQLPSGGTPNDCAARSQAAWLKGVKSTTPPPPDRCARGTILGRGGGVQRNREGEVGSGAVMESGRMRGTSSVRAPSVSAGIFLSFNTSLTLPARIEEVFQPAADRISRPEIIPAPSRVLAQVRESLCTGTRGRRSWSDQFWVLLPVSIPSSPLGGSTVLIIGRLGRAVRRAWGLVRVELGREHLVRTEGKPSWLMR